MFYSIWLHKTVCIIFIGYTQSSIENNNKMNKHMKTHQLFTDISTEILGVTNQIPR